MHSCPNDHLRDILPDWVSGRLAPQERAGVGAHLAACAPCRAEVEILRTVRRTLPAAAPVLDVRRIVAALPAPPRPAARPAGVLDLRERQRRRSWSPAAVRIAAAVAAITVGGSALVLGRGDRPASPVEQLAATADRPAAGSSATPASVAAPPDADARSAALAGDGGDGSLLASIDDPELTAAEYDALMRDLEGADELFTPVVEPAASPLIGGV